MTRKSTRPKSREFNRIYNVIQRRNLLFLTDHPDFPWTTQDDDFLEYFDYLDKERLGMFAAIYNEVVQAKEKDKIRLKIIDVQRESDRIIVEDNLGGKSLYFIPTKPSLVGLIYGKLGKVGFEYGDLENWSRSLQQDGYSGRIIRQYFKFNFEGIPFPPESHIENRKITINSLSLSGVENLKEHILNSIEYFYNPIRVYISRDLIYHPIKTEIEKWKTAKRLKEEETKRKAKEAELNSMIGREF